MANKHGKSGEMHTDKVPTDIFLIRIFDAAPPSILPPNILPPWICPHCGRESGPHCDYRNAAKAEGV